MLIIKLTLHNRGETTNHNYQLANNEKKKQKKRMPHVHNVKKTNTTTKRKKKRCKQEESKVTSFKSNLKMKAK